MFKDARRSVTMTIRKADIEQRLWQRRMKIIEQGSGNIINECNDENKVYLELEGQRAFGSSKQENPPRGLPRDIQPRGP